MGSHTHRSTPSASQCIKVLNPYDKKINTYEKINDEINFIHDIMLFYK